MTSDSDRADNGGVRSVDPRTLLPPEYRVPPELEPDAAGTETSVEASSREQFGVDPALMRIHRRGDAVPVKPLTREARDRRKRLRVAVVFVLGLVILVFLLTWLLNATPDPQLPL